MTNHDQPSSGSEHSSEQAARLRRATRLFFVDVLGLEQEQVPLTFPEDDEVIAQVDEALTYLVLHARTTLYPPEDSHGLVKYKKSVDAAIRRQQALHEVYVQGVPVSALRGVDGHNIRRTQQELLMKSARSGLRALLFGLPGPGWMDGAPIDALRGGMHSVRLS